MERLARSDPVFEKHRGCGEGAFRRRRTVGLVLHCRLEFGLEREGRGSSHLAYALNAVVNDLQMRSELAVRVLQRYSSAGLQVSASSHTQHMAVGDSDRYWHTLTSDQ